MRRIGYNHEYLVMLDSIFHRLNIPYTSIAGNLLSSIGFGGIFPWEYDTDFSIRQRMKLNDLVMPVKFRNDENRTSPMSKLTENYTKHMYGVRLIVYELERRKNWMLSTVHLWNRSILDIIVHYCAMCMVYMNESVEMK